MWLVENLTDQKAFNTNAIVESLTNHNIPFQRVKSNPEIETFEYLDETHTPTFVYGSTLTLRCAKTHGLGNILRISPTESEVASHIGELYMNHDMKVLDRQDAIDYIRDRPYEYFFIKPDTDLKSFSGTVVDSNRVRVFLDNAGNNYIETARVCISPIKYIGSEWRVFIVDGKVSTYSLYMKNRVVTKSRTIDNGALDVLYDSLHRYSPNDIMVVDICEVNGEYKVVEYNTINCSGLYLADVDKLVLDINNYIMR